ncbi:MAG: hypothetical protein QF752_05035 [Planctomycetota bacterium]|nr:hypothetical protein [Planctomycetota bacterium]
MSTFSSARVAHLLATEFVPVAIDSWDYRHGRGEIARYYMRFAREANLNPPNPDGNRSYQGHYVITPSGHILAAQNRRGETAALELLTRARDAWNRLDPSIRGQEVPKETSGPRNLPTPALVLNVYSRVSSTNRKVDPESNHLAREMDRFNRSRTGLDHLWLTERDTRLLDPRQRKVGERWHAPLYLARRIARFHLVDNVRGEPDHYGQKDVAKARLELEVLSRNEEVVEIQIEGSFRMAKAGPYPTRFDGRLDGRIVYNTQSRKWIRFDLLAQGISTGRGRYTPGAPDGTFKLAVAFEIPPDDFAVKIPPQGMRHRDQYLTP